MPIYYCKVFGILDFIFIASVVLLQIFYYITLFIQTHAFASTNA